MSTGEHTPAIEAMYDQEAARYDEFKAKSFAWRYIEAPAFDKFLTGDRYDLPDFYTPDTRVLDIGCGAGQVALHLLSRDIQSKNIVGIDISNQLLELARQKMPDVHFFRASADSFELPAESRDLVTSNMVPHYLDNTQFKKCLELVYGVLRPEGVFFIIDADPDHDEETRKPENSNRWMEIPTPWGGTAPWFNRHYYDLFDMAHFAGFDLAAGFPLPISPGGESASAQEYARYTSFPARMAVCLQKVSEEDKHVRIENAPIPQLTDI